MLPLDFLSGITDFVAVQFGNFAPIIYLIIGILGFLYLADVLISALRGLIERRVAKEPSGFEKILVKVEERGGKLTKKQRKLALKAFLLEERFKGVMKGKGISTNTL